MRRNISYAHLLTLIMMIKLIKNDQVVSLTCLGIIVLYYFRNIIDHQTIWSESK